VIPMKSAPSFSRGTSNERPLLLNKPEIVLRWHRTKRLRDGDDHGGEDDYDEEHDNCDDRYTFYRFDDDLASSVASVEREPRAIRLRAELEVSRQLIHDWTMTSAACAGDRRSARPRCRGPRDGARWSPVLGLALDLATLADHEFWSD
jgi:hypothetical protein